MKDYIFASLHIGPEKNFTYLLLCLKTGEAALFDPAFEPQRVHDWVLRVAGENKISLKMKYFVATHGHPDHAGGFPQLLSYFKGVQIVCGADDEYRLKQYKLTVDLKLKDQEIFNVGDIAVRTIHTPGHTEGGCCYVIENKLLTGDTLFINQCGRTDLKGGSDFELFQSLQKLKTLPGDFIVYPGHDYGPKPFARLLEQLDSNPTLRAKDLESFQALP